MSVTLALQEPVPLSVLEYPDAPEWHVGQEDEPFSQDPHSFGQIAMAGLEILPLSRKEADTLDLYSMGYTNKTAAVERFVSVTTILSQVRAVKRKLSAVTLSHAVRIGIEAGIIPIELKPTESVDSITPTELIELDLMSLGRTIRSSSSYRGVSRSTTATNQRNLRRRLDVHSSPHSVRRGFELGLLPISENITLGRQ